MNYLKKILSFLGLIVHAGVSVSMVAQKDSSIAKTPGTPPITISLGVNFPETPSAVAGLMGAVTTPLVALGHSVPQVAEAFGSIAKKAQQLFEYSSKAISEGIFENDNARAAYALGTITTGSWLMYNLARAMLGQRLLGTAGWTLPGIYGGALATGAAKGAHEHWTSSEKSNN